MLQQIDAAKARNSFSDLLGQVYYGGKSFLIKKLGKPFAVLVSLEDYQRIDKAREIFFETMDEISRRNKDIPYSQVKKDVEEAKTAVRRRKRKSSLG